jgi:hypothetical protein
LQAQGYNVTSLGSYAPRDIAGTGTLSEHAFGNAIDINPATNPVTWNGVVQTDLPPNIRDIAAQNNLVWGGDFGGSKKDAMHFEYNPNVGPPDTSANAPVAYPTQDASGKWVANASTLTEATANRRTGN